MKHKSLRKRYTKHGAKRYTKHGAKRYTKHGAKRYTKHGAKRYTKHGAKHGAKRYTKHGAKHGAKRYTKRYTKRAYKMRGGEAFVPPYPVDSNTTKSTLADQRAVDVNNNKANGNFKGTRGGGKRRKQKGGSCNNDYAPCPPIGMVGPIPQVPDAVDNKLIINAARISAQSIENARYDINAPK